jgi:site-specific DNA recombinase
VWEQIKKYRICISANSVFSILSVVIGEIEHRTFSPVAIDKISSEVYKRAQMMNKEIDKDVRTFEKHLSLVQIKIDNIINAITSGMFHPSMKEKMDKLEFERSDLNRKIAEAKFQSNTSSLSLENITSYLLNDQGIKNKSTDEQKRIIHAYVKKFLFTMTRLIHI